MIIKYRCRLLSDTLSVLVCVLAFGENRQFVSVIFRKLNKYEKKNSFPRKYTF